jgi:hypothetical protein
MQALYTIMAAIVVKYAVDVVKFVGARISQIIPKLPAWVKSLTPLWKLLAAIAVTVLVVWVAAKFKVELTHPLAVLVTAQIAHELSSAIKKSREEG